MSGGELAERARMARSGIYHYISGARIPDESAVKRICAALEIPESEVPPIERRKVGRKPKV
jgi:transcriptional regulator with XRE-family HTH domain